jgi:hypothetical protein
MAGYKHNSSSNIALAAAHFDQIYLCGKVQSHRIVSRFIFFEALTCIQNARLAGWTPHPQQFTTPLQRYGQRVQITVAALMTSFERLRSN